MSARSYNRSTAQQQSYSSSSSKYRNNQNNRSGFGSRSNGRLNDDPQNIMHDRRVIRGSTYSLRRSIESRLNSMDNTSTRNNTLRRKNKMNTNQRNNKYKINNKNENKKNTPRAVAGRIHAEIQTDPYLEEIRVTAKEKTFGTQTDPFLDRPSSPLFEPKTSGKSIATQIEDGDLFNFDISVEPILEVLIGKTIEQSLIEVLEEEELKTYTKYKEIFKQKRNIQLIQCQRLEQEQKRKELEKENRIKQLKIHQKNEKLLKKRIFAQKIATEFLQNIENYVFDELNKKGHFYDPIIKEIETIFIPELFTNIENEINKINISNKINDDIINNINKDLINESIKNINLFDKQKNDEIIRKKKEKELNNKFKKKRKEFTKAIKSQKNDFDFKQQIINFVDIPLTQQKIENNDNDDDDDKKQEEEEEEDELSTEIKSNIEYIDNLIEQFENDDEPLWKQITSILDKIGGETAGKIERIEKYLEIFEIKSSKKELLKTFEIYKDNEENLKKAIINCLNVDVFNEDIHNKYLDALKGDEEKDQMETMDEFTKNKANVKEFITTFIEKMEQERKAEEEAKKEQQAVENDEQNDDDNA